MAQVCSGIDDQPVFINLAFGAVFRKVKPLFMLLEKLFNGGLSGMPGGLDSLFIGSKVFSCDFAVASFKVLNEG